MKFKFCGDADAPDWLLAESMVLAKLSSVRVKLLCSHIVKEIKEEPMDAIKVVQLMSGKRLAFNKDDMKAIISALSFIVHNAARFDVTADQLDLELEQIGLPKDICRVICQHFAGAKQEIREFLKSNPISPSLFESLDWKILKTVEEAEFVELEFKDTIGGVSKVKLSRTQFGILHEGLKECKDHFESVLG